MTSADQCSTMLFMSSGTEAHQNETLCIQDRITTNRRWNEWFGDGSDLGYKSGTDLFVIFPIICTTAEGSGSRAELFGAAETAALGTPRDSLATRDVGIKGNLPIPPDFNEFQLGNAGANFTSGVFGQPSQIGASFRRQLPSQYNAKDLFTMDLIHPSGQDFSLPNNQQYCGAILVKAYSKGSLKKHAVQLGIEIAAGVTALFAIVIVIFLWRRRRQGGRRRGEHSYSYSPIDDKDGV